MLKNTYCKRCIFSGPADSESSCEFAIPTYIKDIKNIEIKEGYNYIYHYACKYGMDKDIFEQNKELQSVENIKEYIINKAFIEYFLLIDIRPINNLLENLITQINTLDIKPKFISFVNHDFNNTETIIKYITSNLASNIKWKLHNFILDLSLEKILNVILDTNAGANNSKIFHIYEPRDNIVIGSNLLNDRINFIHFTTIVEQKLCHGFFNNYDTLDGLALPFSAFKHLYNCETKSIMKELKKQTELILLPYEHDA